MCELRTEWRKYLEMKDRQRGERGYTKGVGNMRSCRVGTAAAVLIICD